jgi:uncharacterized membrane protein YcjF (UPF0283 family)
VGVVVVAAAVVEVVRMARWLWRLAVSVAMRQRDAENMAQSYVSTAAVGDCCTEGG